MNIPALKSDRFVLRAFRESDVPALADLHGDGEVMRYLSGEPEPSPRKAWDYMAMQMGHWLLKGYGKWVLADPATDELIGRVGYFDAPYEWPGLELGWTIARSHWGRGLATASARLALDWGFTHLKTDEIISAILPGNTRSMAVAERLGERYVRDAAIGTKACRIYAITREEWRAHDRS